MDKMTEQIDQLIWQLAETEDTAARADFEQRYPQFRAALATRVAMVDVLRSAKPVAPIPTRFVPAKPERTPRRWILLAPLAAGLLIGVAFAAYQVGKMNTEPEAAPVVNTAPRYVSPTPAPPQSRGIEPNSVPEGSGTAPRPPIQENQDFVVLQANTSLFTAIAAIREKGLKIEIMPGVEDKPLTLQPNRDDGTLALEPNAMLQAVKAAAGIELVDAGPDGILILPSERTTITDPNRVRPEDIGN